MSPRWTHGNLFAFSGHLATSLAGSARDKTAREREQTFNNDQTHSSNSVSKRTSAAQRTAHTPLLNLKSSSKVGSEDPALAIMKTILVHQQAQSCELAAANTKSESTLHATSARQSSKSKSRVEKEKLAKTKLTR